MLGQIHAMIPGLYLIYVPLKWEDTLDSSTRRQLNEI